MKKAKRKTVKKRIPVVHLKQINFTLREYASIQIYASNMVNGISAAEAIRLGSELADKLKQIRIPFTV